MSEEQRDNGVLTIMLCGRSWPWSVEELEREIHNRGEAVDAVARLAGAGLVHRLGEFVFPTRAARRADELGIGGA